MNKKNSLSKVPKSELRTWIIEQLLSAMKSDEIFHTLNYRQKREAYIKQYMHQIIKKRLFDIHRRISPGQKEATLKLKASASLIWEGDVNTIINNIRFLGAQHRPDFKVLVSGLNIAIEVKRGESGAAIREGIGQSLIYAASGDFDFVVYLFIDVSKDKKIHESLRNDREMAFVDSLWEKYNIRLDIV